MIIKRRHWEKGIEFQIVRVMAMNFPCFHDFLNNLNVRSNSNLKTKIKLLNLSLKWDILRFYTILFWGIYLISCKIRRRISDIFLLLKKFFSLQRFFKLNLSSMTLTILNQLISATFIPLWISWEGLPIQNTFLLYIININIYFQNLNLCHPSDISV